MKTGKKFLSFFCVGIFIHGKIKIDNIFLSCFNINLLELLSFFWVLFKEILFIYMYGCEYIRKYMHEHFG